MCFRIRKRMRAGACREIARTSPRGAKFVQEKKTIST